MLRLIIVDDEYLLRQLIRNIIDWKALDIEVVGEMASAELAMRQLESLKPDIILTDICMPDIDGLTFAEKIKKWLTSAGLLSIISLVSSARRGRQTE